MTMDEQRAQEWAVALRDWTTGEAETEYERGLREAQLAIYAEMEAIRTREPTYTDGSGRRKQLRALQAAAERVTQLRIAARRGAR